MTTVPLDDVEVGAGEGAATATGESAEPRPPSVANGPGDAGPALPAWRLVARWKAAGHRVLPGIMQPVAVWVVWRLSSLAISVYLGGSAGRAALFYDSAHYLRIMHRGYNNPRWIMPSHTFFPAVSWLGWPIWKLTDSDLWAVHLVASATAVAAFICVWGVSKAWRDEVVARRAVVLFALFPSSLFLWAFYSEGIFIALGAGAVWADRRGKRGVAAALLLGIGATRSIGILIPLVIILVRIIHQRRIDKWCLIYGARARPASLPCWRSCTPRWVTPSHG